MKHRIGIIADALDEQYAGIYTYARELISCLLELDSENEYTFIHQVKNDFFANQKEILVPLNRSNPLDVFHRKIVRLPALLRQQKFDLVHDLFHIPPFAFRKIPSRTVVTIHDLTPVLVPAWHPWVTVMTHRMLLPRIFRNTTRIIAVSQSTASDIERLYGAVDVRNVPLGTRGLPPPPDRPRTFPFILFVGTLEPRKNIPTLVDAYERIRALGRTEKLVIIGKKGWHYDNSLNRIRRSPYANDIILPGFMDEATLSWHYHNASAFVYPSLYEGFGLPVLEAMNCGCPVITSNISSLPEVVGDAGLLADPNNAKALADHMMAILGDDALRQNMAARGKQRAKIFTWRNTARQTLDIYRELLETPA